MISDETPYKLAEIVRDTWPNIFRKPQPLTMDGTHGMIAREPKDKMILTIQETEDGDLFLELPDNLLQTLSWYEGDQLQWVIAGESIILKKVND